MHQQSGWTATPSRLIGAPTSAIPTIFTQDALLYKPSQFILLGTGTKYAGLHTQWLGYTKNLNDKKTETKKENENYKKLMYLCQ